MRHPGTTRVALSLSECLKCILRPMADIRLPCYNGPSAACTQPVSPFRMAVPHAAVIAGRLRLCPFSGHGSHVPWLHPVDCNNTHNTPPTPWSCCAAERSRTLVLAAQADVGSLLHGWRSGSCSASTRPCRSRSQCLQLRRYFNAVKDCSSPPTELETHPCLCMDYMQPRRSHDEMKHTR